MKKLLLCIIVCLFSSCATIFNKNYTTLFLYTENPAKVVYKADTVHTQLRNGFNAVALAVPRSRDYLSLSVMDDSVNKGVHIPSKNSLAFYFDMYPIFWPGLLLDLYNPKRYTYKSPLLLDKNLTLTEKIPSVLKRDLSERKKLQPNIDAEKYLAYKGDVVLNLTFPYVNYFNLKPGDEKRKDYFGFIGIGLGLDYYYKPNRFISLIASGSVDFPVFAPAPVDYDDEGVHTHIYSSDIMLTHNHRYKRFTYGYGLAVARNSWYYHDEGNYIYYSKHTSALGIGLRSHYYFSSKFTVGLIYRPTFVVLSSSDNKAFKYEHLLSLDFAFKFRLNKRK